MKYVTQGVCTKEIYFDLIEGKVYNVKFVGGCPGNLNAISTLVEGMPADEVIAKFSGNVCRNNTSCTDQLAKALKEQI
ncbi:TIGR03905 family TSCPD domain-containing protein [Pelosinus sp. IPA-1]|uniref:TIGR03905 family TSCPD domain-containing protein n=1 Tax=Pelosinus sp. IPA-1 TaxID=3029569 RepID=UPI0024361848|nr:TIGR03905 family TSCPD domain-containing protein [Pelosinus sp. IPA-1]GMB01957.1 TSCPD domain-containing protein [Pelosinus sp. IPA-1]